MIADMYREQMEGLIIEKSRLQGEVETWRYIVSRAFGLRNQEDIFYSSTHHIGVLSSAKKWCEEQIDELSKEVSNER